ncbi:MAG TPA: hypothetical protein VHM64_04060, partial [Candidatus Binatia bacterium]|nr:hypothetical protein [Candidatus Binatia bacterium]
HLRLCPTPAEQKRAQSDREKTVTLPRMHSFLLGKFLRTARLQSKSYTGIPGRLWRGLTLVGEI